MSIYKITHPDYNDCYIGSTKSKLNKRLSSHKTHSLYPDKYKSKLYDIMRETNKTLFKIELLENCELSIKREREQYYIDKYCPKWNTIKSFITEEQKKEYEKLRQQQEKLKNYKKEWHQKNKERVLNKMKERTDNDPTFKEKRKLYMREYRKRTILTM